MARAFARIAFTTAVQAAQARLGSADAYRATLAGPVEPVELGAFETEFITARDSFYQGTVGETGWPYVQHRGGPKGFLKVLDSRTLGYADFSGNRQYLSVGNLVGDDRISLFLMDYPNQRRLKIWGRARLVDEDQDPALIARLESPNYRARVERGVVITVEAFDWNCPKYITPRYTEDEVHALVDERRAAHPAGAASREAELGRGPLKLVVSGMRDLSPRIRAFELRAADSSDLPSFTAGAHLAVPIRLADGAVVTRQYSLASDPHQRDHYEIAVLRDEDGRGGSAALHATWQLGLRLAVEAPVNQFPLHADDRPAVLIAGGIGITPLKAMAHALKARGNPFALHYIASTATDMAYRQALVSAFPGQVHLYFTRNPGSVRPDLHAIMRSAPPGAVFYLCGPDHLLDALRTMASKLGIAADRVQYESFA